MTKSKQQKNAILTIVCLLALAVFGAAMVWLHYQQLCSPGGGDDPYTSDLGQHLYFAQQGMIYSTVSLLIGPAYDIAGRIGIAVLLAVFHLAAVAVFAWGLRAALPESTRPVRLLVSLAVNLATAVWMPRGGYWYQGTVGGTIYHNTTYIMLAPFALLTMLAFYRVWPTVRGRLDLRSYAVYTVLLTVATSFKANLIFAFAPALLVLLVVDFVRSRAKNLKNEILMGCSVFPGVALCFVQARVLFAAEDSGIRLIFTVPFDHHRMLWGPFNEAGVLGLARSFVFAAAVGLLLGRAAWKSFRYRFSLFTFAVSMAEALLLVESGERLYHANLWWGPFICFWAFWLESVSVFLAQCRAKAPRWRLVLCGLALVWHLASGVCFLVMLLCGVSYNVPILTYNLWLKRACRCGMLFCVYAVWLVIPQNPRRLFSSFCGSAGCTGSAAHRHRTGCRPRPWSAGWRTARGPTAAGRTGLSTPETERRWGSRYPPCRGHSSCSGGRTGCPAHRGRTGRRPPPRR